MDRTLKAALVAAPLLLAGTSDGAAQAPPPEALPPDGTVEYAIVRNGDRIGTHRVTFRREGDRLHVDVDVDVAVRVLGIVAYRFTQRATETWRGGRLVALQSTGNDDGTPFDVRVREADGGLLAEARGRAVRFAADAVPTTVWTAAQLQRRTLINTVTGAAMPASTRDLGERSFTVGGRPVPARGTFLDATNDYQRWMWFDAAARLIHLELRGRDGSQVEYRLP